VRGDVRRLLTTGQLKEKAIEILSRIPDFHEAALTIEFRRTLMDCVPFIEAKDDSYVYLYYERGQCIEKRETRNVDEALFWIFESYISVRSIDYELHNRIRYVDHRRLRFKKQDMLFSLIGEPYYSMNKRRISEVLKSHPYNDHQIRALDLVGDFERIAKMLQKSAIADLKFSADYRNNIDFFIQKPYRNQYGGIANFKETFASMLSKYTLIVEDLRKRNFPIRVLGVYDEIRKIEEQMSKIDPDSIIG